MKLFLILYTVTGIGASWGPLPYGMEECRERAAAFQQELVATAAQHPDTVPSGEDARDWRMACEWREQRPQLTVN